MRAGRAIRPLLLTAAVACGARTSPPIGERANLGPGVSPRATLQCVELSVSTPVELALPDRSRPPIALLGAVERAGVLDILTVGAVVRLSHVGILQFTGETQVKGIGYNQAFASNGKYLAAWGGPTRHTIVDENNLVVSTASVGGDESASAAWHGDRLTASNILEVNAHTPAFLSLGPDGTVLTSPTADGFTPGPHYPVAIATRSGVVQMMVAPASAEVRFAAPGEPATTLSISGRIAFVTEWPFDTTSIVWHDFVDGGSGPTPVTIQRMDSGGIQTVVTVIPLTSTRRHAIKLVPSRWGLIVLDLANVDDIATDVSATLVHADGRISEPVSFRADNAFTGSSAKQHAFVFGEIDVGGIAVAWNPAAPKDPSTPWRTRAVSISCER